MCKAHQMPQALLEKREAVRLLLGLDFHEIMAEYGEIITRVATARKIDIVSASFQMIGESPELDSMGILYLVVAAVELIDPSPSEVANG